jgi:hypothetical protein
MQIGVIPILVIEFPDPAGQYQREGMTASLIRELGDNYARYHGFLADKLAGFDKIPEFADFATSQEYLDQWALIHDILRAEAALRTCRAFRLLGTPLDQPLDFSHGEPPIVDDNYRLVSVV